MFSSKLNSCPSTFSDRSMLEALGGPGERSILSQKRMMGNGDVEEDKRQSPGDEEARGDSEEKRGNDERPGSHSFESADEASEGKAEKREEEEEEFDEKRAKSEENPEESTTKDKKGK